MASGIAAEPSISRLWASSKDGLRLPNDRRKRPAGGRGACRPFTRRHGGVGEWSALLGADQPLMAPDMKPRTYWPCSAKNSSKHGSAITTTPASSEP